MPAEPMATPPPTEAPRPHGPPARAPGPLLGHSRAQRELILLGVLLAFGLLVMPLLVWLAGHRALGPYTHGDNPNAGPFALLAAYFAGLAHGSAVFWVVALGPAALLYLLRGFFALLRVLPAGGGD
jgi:hypothetical protein